MNSDKAVVLKYFEGTYDAHARHAGVVSDALVGREGFALLGSAGKVAIDGQSIGTDQRSIDIVDRVVKPKVVDLARISEA